MIYLASPYSHPDHAVMVARYEAARAAAAELLRQGALVYSPIVHGHAIAMAHELPTDFEWWMRHSIDMLSRAEGMCVLKLPGWDQSRGVKAEIDWWGGNRETDPMFVEAMK